MAKKPNVTSIHTARVVDIQLNLIGTSPLIVHRFPEKTRKELIGKQMQVGKAPREAREPEREFEESRYRLNDRIDGFPASAFKAAAVTGYVACVDPKNGTRARRGIFVEGFYRRRPGVLDGAIASECLVPLRANAPIMVEHVVRLSGAGRPPEMRYRPQYDFWAVQLRLRLTTTLISQQEAANLFDLAGHVCGVGENRIDKGGDNGTWRVANEDELEAYCEAHGIAPLDLSRTEVA